MRLVLLALALGLWSGCRKSVSISSEGGATCDLDQEVKLSHVEDGEVHHARCVPRPAACAARCESAACKDALFTQCDSGWQGVGCADVSGFPLIVSCNRR